MNAPTWLLTTYGFLLGAVFASFCAVVVERTARKESLNGRSHCSCGRQLRATENIPLVGWISTGGRARCCGAKIPAHYVLLEAGLGVLTALVAATTGLAGMIAVLAAAVAGSFMLGYQRRR